MKFFNYLKYVVAASCVAGVLNTAYAEDEVAVGLALDLSGPFAPLGAEARAGFDLAFKQLNQKLGGLTAKVIAVDISGSPDRARQAVDRMVKLDKINLFSGPIASNVAISVGPVLATAKVPFVSSNPGPSHFAGNHCSPNFIGLHYQNDMWDEAMGVYATNENIRNVYLVAPNYPAGKDHLAGFKRQYKGEIVAEVYNKLGQIDYAAEIAEIRAKKPEAVYFFLPGAMGINFVKQFMAAGLSKDTRLFLGAGSGEPEIVNAVGKPMLGLISATQWAPDLPNEANKTFVAAFEKEYRRYPSVFAAMAYDTVMAMDAAVKSMDGRLDDKDALQQAFKTAKYDSIRGDFTLDRNNFPLQRYYFREVSLDESGRFYNKTIGQWEGGADAYVEQCPLK